MHAFWLTLTGLEKVFAICALAGGILLLVRLVLMFIGGDGDVDVADASDFDGGSDVSFRILSLQGLTGFFTMFGLVGLAMSRGGSGLVPSMVVALAAGLSTVWILDRMFRFIKGMQSVGTLEMDSAIGREGTVYLHIPAKGTGKVQIEVQNRLRVFDAVTEGDVTEEVETGERVQVLRIAEGTVLVVKKL